MGSSVTARLRCAQFAIFSILCTGAFPTAFAATRWVAVNGSDTSGNGTSGSPWATIGRALDGSNDGDLVLVRPGTYVGRVELRGTFANGVVVRSEVPYRAKLRRDATVVICYYGQGITLEGFDIAHLDSAGPLLIQIQDLRGAPGGTDRVRRITLRDNIIHDSRDNDLLKINNGATEITVTGNMFYNQTGPDEHIDINGASFVTVQDNVFFNDFEGSGRTNANDTSSYIVIKDSNAGSDGDVGSANITIRRNVFLHWQGSAGANFVLVGEDGMPYFEAHDVLIENNLLLGDSPHTIRAPFGVKGGRDITFRSNTVAGNLPAEAYAARFNVEGENPANQNIVLTGNIWSDPTGTMVDFSDTPPAETTSFVLNRNLYWNGGAAIPSSGSDLINWTSDAQRLAADPRLTAPTGIVLPRWQEANGRFADGTTSIRDVFIGLVERRGHPDSGSAAVNAGSAATAATDDILGRPRAGNGAPDLGAYETSTATSVEDPVAAIGGLTLRALAPNPFRGSTTLRFVLTHSAPVRIDVLDVAGRRVRTLLESARGPGEHTAVWDGRDDAGRSAAGGVFVVRVRAGDRESRAKIVRLRGE